VNTGEERKSRWKGEKTHRPHYSGKRGEKSIRAYQDHSKEKKKKRERTICCVDIVERAKEGVSRSEKASPTGKKRCFTRKKDFRLQKEERLQEEEDGYRQKRRSSRKKGKIPANVMKLG